MRLRHAIVFGLLFAFVVASQAESVLEVTLRSDVALPAGTALTLGEVAALAGSGAEEVARVELGRVPGPRQLRAVSRLTVQRALELAGIERESIRLLGASQVRVRGEGVALDQEEVEAVVREALARIAPEADITLERLQMPRGVQLPAGEHELRVSEEFSSPCQGTNRIPLEVVTDGGVRTIGLYARLVIEGPLVVAARDVRRGEQVSEADLRVEHRSYPPGRRLFHDPDEVVGLVARGTLRAGDPLRGASLSPADAVVTGQSVQAVYRSGQVELLLDTRARASGAVGEIIPVVGQDGTSIIQARVVDTGRVEILGSEVNR